MNARVRGRRAALLLSLALASGGLAASEVASRVQEVDARVGRPVPVLVTRRDVGPGTPLERADLEIRHVPGRFAPTGALTTPDKAIGSEPATAMARGSYVTAALLGGTDARGGPRVLRAGERAVEVGVADGGALTTDVGPGARVDVLVSTEQREGAGVSFIALEDVELLDLRDASGEAPTAPGDADGAAPASSVATLRVTLRQAVYLTAAQNFAREVRLLPRPAGDRRRSGHAAVGVDGLLRR